MNGRGALALLALLSVAGPGGTLRADDPVIAAAGDIACDPADPAFSSGLGTASRCRQKATSDLLVGGGYAAVLALGDTQYEVGSGAAYLASYAPSWGRVKGITYPVPGNHEHLTPGASGYYGYFGAAAGDPAKGWYSFDVGTWHVVVLESTCAAVSGCGPGSPQEQWLRADLAAHPAGCLLAAWHQPRFSSGTHGNDPAYDAFWRAIHDAGVDVVLNGHDHDYERFDPQDPDGQSDPAHGVREFVVGTGGKNQTPFATIRANSAARSSGTFGVLALALHPGGYDWRFVPADGGPAVDAGSASCHRPTPTAGLSLYTVTPCRLVDTRGPEGPRGGPSLAGNAVRSFPVADGCGVPPYARAVSVNVTVTAPAAPGFLTLFPEGDAAPPLASTINFRSGDTRANAAVLPLAGDGGGIRVGNGAAGPVHLVLDVSGYFR